MLNKLGGGVAQLVTDAAGTAITMDVGRLSLRRVA